MKRIIALFIIFFFAFPLASIAAEPAWWTQKKRECGVSTSYNTWVSQGSPCNKSGGSPGGLSPGQELGTALGQALGQAIGNALRGDPEADARRKAEEEYKAAQAAEESRRQEEETLKRHEEMKNRLLGGMLNVGDSSQLGLMGADSGSGLSLMTDDLHVKETSGASGQKELKPIIGDTGTGAIKVTDKAEKESSKAQKGFDTAGKIMNSDLPAAPSVPAAKPVSPSKLEKMNILKTTLKKNEDEEKALKALLEKLRQSPGPDEKAMKELQKEITAKEDEKKKIEKDMEDLTATE